MTEQDLFIAGVDEAGRGPWAGPVYAAAVILPESYDLIGLKDSKKLSENKREKLSKQIKASALTYAIAYAHVDEIDTVNIREATFLAMRRALNALNLVPTYAQIDGNASPSDLPCAAEAIIGGDGLIPAISAASILAKTARDALMVELDAIYKGYGFAKHKGYGTAAHKAALDALGPCPIHRKSFKPIANLL